MNRKSFLPFIFMATSILIEGCNLPRIQLAEATQTPTLLAPTDTASPLPTTELGLAENPLILALPPASDAADVEAARVIANQLMDRTGYVVVTVIPDSQAALVDALVRGNAHIVLLEPFAYELAHQKGLVKAAFAVLNDGKSKYGAQFIAARKAGFTSYVNPLNGTNAIKDADIALSQLHDKKPCWTDETSASGYVIPLGYLNSIQAVTKPAAFVEGHPSVVRALYAGGICDFGATYIDARKFPSLEDEFPDLIEQVIVIWQIPEIIPYDVLAFSSKMSQSMRDVFAHAIPAVLQTNAGSAAFTSIYEIEELEPVNDAFYNEFRKYVEASGVELTIIVK
jgi:phosphonate transport system substrate-binding protein